MCGVRSGTPSCDVILLRLLFMVSFLVLFVVVVLGVCMCHIFQGSRLFCEPEGVRRTKNVFLPLTRTLTLHLSIKQKHSLFTMATLRNADENQVPPLCPSKRRASEGSVPQEDDVMYWKNMYFALRQQGVQELDAFSQESEKREKALKGMLRMQETEIRELKMERKESEVKIKGMEDVKVALEETKSELEQVQMIVEKQEKEIELHRLLTGTTLSNVDMTKQVACDCTVKNQETKRSTSFRLESSNDNETCCMLKYEPIGQPDSTLPEFLHSAIEFDVPQTPALMQHVLQGMFPDDD